MVRGWYGYFKHACRREFPSGSSRLEKALCASLK
ncbi:MAG: hypothetical protein HZC43_10685 [Nitrosomonadales bacterium]|nr:hypothetical protein [Nitrosomonadales bacterium]